MGKRLDPRVRDMTEAELSQEVVRLAVKLGWKVYGIRRTDKSRLVHPSGVGWPDLVLFRPGMILFAELKRHGGKLSPEQEDWLSCLASTFTNVHHWEPTDWFDGSITDVLRSFLPHTRTPPPPPGPMVA